MSINDENTEEIFNNIKNLIAVAVKDRHHAFHTPVFSNQTLVKSIASRVVVIRSFDANSLKLNFHTDYRSPKIIDLKNNNLSSFVFYDHNLKIQIRLETKSKINNKNELTKKVWQQTPLYSRKCYLTKKSPSSITTFPEDGLPEYLKGKTPTEKETENGYNNFSIIENKILNIDWLFLASTGHRRLKIIFKKKEPLFKWMIP